MKPDFTVSLSFLRSIYPTGPWMLTAITVDKKAIDARTFDEADESAMMEWLGRYHDRNLYYSVNQPTTAAREKRKLSKADVSQVHFLHVDVDPRVGEPVEKEQERIFAELCSYRIRSSHCVFSGGGYNALWRLEEPIDVAHGASSEEEAIARAIDVERRNWQFELDFNTPDHCRDVSRILRLPGTINRPNAEKVAKGRVPALSRIEWCENVSYPLSTFMATPHVTANAGVGASKVSQNVERVESLDHLLIPEKLKVMIAQGFDPEDQKYDGDRSKTLFHVVCELVRAGINDEQIMGVITDSRFLISASVLDKGSGMTRYAIRQVQRARDKADHPLLAEMNEKYAVVLNYGAQTSVMVERGHFSEISSRHEPVFQSFRAFKDRIKRYPSVEYQASGGKTKSIPAYEWWTSHPRRREFDEITFEPGLDTPGRYNFWTGFACQPVAGDKHKRYLDHCHDIICAGNDEHYEYLVRWMARVVQQPRTQTMVAPVVVSPDRGTGKSTFTRLFGEMFEPHSYTASNMKELTGRFNAHLCQCVYVVAEEAYDPRDKRHEGILKELITGHTISIERKGVDRIRMPNYTHLIITSNNERVIPAGDHERRFFVLRVSSARRQDSSYFGRITDDYRNGGMQNLLHHLMTIDLTNFDVTRVPTTKALREQQEQNLTYEREWLLEKLDSGSWLGQIKVPWRGPVNKKALHENYREFMTSVGAKAMKGERAFHNFVMTELQGTTDRQLMVGGQRPMVFDFPPLDECRRLFDDSRGWRDSDWRETAVEDPQEQERKVLPFE